MLGRFCFNFSLSGFILFQKVIITRHSASIKLHINLGIDGPLCTQNGS